MKWKLLLGASGVVLVGLVVGELVARLALGLGNPPLSVAHPTIEYLFKPNQDVLRFGNRVLINAYGMRSPDFPRGKADPAERRILVFGDSVLNGGNLTDHEQLATTKVARELRDVCACPVTVGNVSAGSWGPGNWLAYAQTYGFFDADAVMVVMSSHDTADNPSYSPLNPKTHPTVRPWSALVEGATRYLPRWLPDVLVAAEEPEPPVVAQEAGALAQGLRDLTAFLQTAKAAAPHVAVMLWPEREEMAAGLPKPGWAHAESVCRDVGVPCISLRPEVERALSAGRQPYRDNIHANDEGQAVIAEALLAYLGGPVAGAVPQQRRAAARVGGPL